MKSKLIAVLAAAVALFAVSGPALAHHGGAQYDAQHPVTVTGVVTEYIFTNPHVQVHFDVTDENGKVDKWIAETASPQRLFSFGWNAKTLKPGDKITVTGAQLKDGQKIMSIIKLTGGNAPVLTQGAGNTP
jgi:tRNA(Ile2) C34 agmatinyltransferase TiaS